MKNNPINEALPDNVTIKRIKKIKRSRRKERLSAEQCHMLLSWTEENNPELLVFPVVCLFAGLRPGQEETSIDWFSITISQTVDNTIVKDRETRIIEPLTPNLAEWIGFIDSKGVKPFPIGNLRRRWDRAKQLVERKWPHDSMRHSYASYHFAMFGNASLIVKNLGYPNLALLKKDCNEIVSRAEARKFWSIDTKNISGNYPSNNLNPVDYHIQYQFV